MNTNTEAVLDGLRDINITTDDRDYASITFDAIQEIENMDSRIAELERALELAESNLHDEHLEYYEADLTALKEQGK